VRRHAAPTAAPPANSEAKGQGSEPESPGQQPNRLIFYKTWTLGIGQLLPETEGGARRAVVKGLVTLPPDDLVAFLRFPANAKDAQHHSLFALAPGQQVLLVGRCVESESFLASVQSGKRLKDERREYFDQADHLFFGRLEPASQKLFAAAYLSHFMALRSQSVTP
jgi:hypothetical protein